MAQTRTEEFLMDLDEGMLAYFREMAHEMVTRFGISRAEAVARINWAYQGRKFGPYPDLMCHELPEYWDYGLYFKPNAGRLPDDDRDTGLCVWEVRPAPHRHSPAWTLEA
ncbi:hypothetical protein [Streptomyces sp. NBC_00996]|uniref:hypothetical protein n=1 Tax=Streptomyces sp. NBC_00996 TaxID=2903710 RepID=UPI00386DE7CC|nr:hypothetical protein OG390_30545 [Streptomyces sp. NBC_00996]